MKRRWLFNKKNLVLGVVLLISATGIYGADTNESGRVVESDVILESSNLPIMVIDTHGGTIVDSPRIMAEMGIIFNGEGQRNLITNPWNEYSGYIGIEYRGSTSKRFFPKKPYRIETQDITGENLNVSLLGMPEENDWVLHNPYSDKSLMRNILACHMARKLGGYASRTCLIELVLNNEYLGIYVLMEKIKRDKKRVDITKMDIDDVQGDSLTGGYIVKLDKTAGEQFGGWGSGKVFFQYHYPKPDRITTEQAAYIQTYISEFEDRISGVDESWRDLIDLDTFVDYFIVNEVSRNIDGYRLSTYLYKDRDSKGGRLCMGPVWDFNIAFGNVDYFNGNSSDGWNLDLLIDQTGHEYTPPSWWSVIKDDPEFNSRFQQRWDEARAEWLNDEYINAFIDSVADYLSEAQVRNFQKWPVLGTRIWPNAFIGSTYEEEIAYLKSFVSDRIAWIDDSINLIQNDVAESVSPFKFSLEQNYPNPFKVSTQIVFHLLEAGPILLDLYSMNGSLVKNIADGWHASGRHSVHLNGSDMASGCYLCRLCVGNQTDTIEILLIK
ncbi:CotH kinase family protein [bacterium]|nr:CotH kinase family protein [bacterium]